MNILVIANGIASFDGVPNISGGDVRFLEIMRRWLAWGHRVHLLSPPAGVELAKRFGIFAEFHPLPISDGAGFLSYAHRALASAQLPSTLKNFQGAVYSSTEHIYDALPALPLVRQGNPWAAVVHLVSPAPWKRRASGLINATLFYGQQRVGLNLIKRYANAALAVSPATAEDYIGIGGNRKRVHVVTCGVDSKWVEQPPHTGPFTYDGIYMGRLHPGKGIFDLVEIWGRVCHAKPGARLAIMGQGSEEIRSRMIARADELGVTGNIEFLGPIYDVDKKLEILRSSRVFLMPSHGENWGIVIGEALAAGLPVVCYDLASIRPVWQQGVSWVPFADYQGFTTAVLNLLEQGYLWEQHRRDGREFASQLSWDAVAARELELLTNTAGDIR